MKKLVPIAVLSLGLALGVPAAAVAEQTCVDEVLDPIIRIPITVCVDVPGLPEVPPLPDVPLVPPIEVPPVVVPPIEVPDQPAPVNPPEAPSPPAEPTEQAPEESVTPPVEPKAEDPVVEKKSPPDEAITRFQELAFPFAVFLGLLTLMFGGSQLYKFLSARKAKRLDKEETVL